MSQPETTDALDFTNPVEERTVDLTSTWKDAPSRWGHSIHSLAPYVGRYPPTLPHYFIRRFSDIGDTVLDPFCGGGTTPFEAALNNRYALGNDAFSYAYHLSKAKCNPLTELEFESYLDGKLMAAKAIDKAEVLLDHEDIRVFYSEYTLDQILRLREVLKDDESPEAIYLKAIMCGILHGPSDMFLSLQTKDTYSGTANYVQEYAEKHDLKKPERDIRPRLKRKHELAQEDYIPPWIASRTTITQSDARDLPFDDGAADLLITSPPYMRVLDYTWNNWIRIWWLNRDREDERNNLDITQDVEKYRTFMRECLDEMYRVLAPDSVAILVVGDVKKNLAAGKRTLNTAGYIAEEAKNHTGFEVHGVIEDAYDIDNRGYVIFNQLKYDYSEDMKGEKSKVPIDRCLILRKGYPDMNYEPEINWEQELYKQE